MKFLADENISTKLVRFLPTVDKLKKAITTFLIKFKGKEIENHLMIIEETEVIVFPKEIT